MRGEGGTGPTGERGTAPTGVPGGSDGAGDDPVFVLCAGRSGSTLLRFLLDAHPDLACPPETRLPWLARQLATAWAVIEDAGPSGQSANGSSADAAISAPVAEGLRRSLDPMMTSYLRRRGKRRYCDKSLGAAQHAGLLLRIWPGARFICLYRHPMDVIASGIEASPWGLTSYGFEPYIGSPPDNNVAALARYWLDYTTSIVAAEENFTDRCLPVRYEDLVTDPDAEIARIFDQVFVTDMVTVPRIPALNCQDRRRVIRPVPGQREHGVPRSPSHVRLEPVVGQPPRAGLDSRGDHVHRMPVQADELRLRKHAQQLVRVQRRPQVLVAVSLLAAACQVGADHQVGGVPDAMYYGGRKVRCLAITLALWRRHVHRRPRGDEPTQQLGELRFRWAGHIRVGVKQQP